MKWKDLNWKIIRPKKEIYESKLLKLNSKKAHNLLKWKCLLNANQTLELVTSWYKYYYKNKKQDMYFYSTHQIKKYENILKNKTK